MTQESIKILEDFGFKPFLDGSEIMLAFENSTYAYDTKMIVQGDHADDYATIIFANEKDFTGLCYCSSLMEHLMLNFDDHGVEKIVKELQKASIYVELRCVCGYPMIAIDLGKGELSATTLKSRLSHMLKAVGALDYLLQKRLKRLRK